MLHTVDDVRHNGTRRGQLARAFAVEHHVARRVAAHHNAVEYIVHARKLAAAVHEHRANHNMHLSVFELLHRADELNDTAPNVCKIDVLQRDLRNALCVNGIRVHVRAERQRRQNADLAAGVQALHIGARVALRVTKLLCKLQGVFKVHLLADHLRQNEVRRAVQNTGNLRYIVCGKALADGADDRNAAADARLKQEVEVIRLRDCKELRALLCHKLFIGGHNALAVFQTRLHKVIRRVQAAHHFHDDLYLGVI